MIFWPPGIALPTWYHDDGLGGGLITEWSDSDSMVGCRSRILSTVAFLRDPHYPPFCLVHMSWTSLSLASGTPPRFALVTGLFLSNENTIGPAIDLLALVLREASMDR